MRTVSFTIPGEPRGKARARSTAKVVWRDGEPHAIITVHSDPAMRQAEQDVLRLFRAAHPRHAPFTGPVLLKFVAVFAIPASWPKKLREAAARGTLYAVKKPDKDNIEKLIKDALSPPDRKRGQDGPSPNVAGYAWVNDQQVMGGGIKRYGHPPRTEVTLQGMDQPDIPATPGERRNEARVAAGDHHTPPARRAANPPKLKSDRQPSQLQLRIDAALAREQLERGQK